MTIWMPYTQMQGAKPLLIERGEGASLITQDGRRLLDAVSSWWVVLHGHARPELAEAVYRQALKLEQVIAAGYSHDPAQALSRRIVDLTPEPLQHLFFSDNGSTAVEVGLKMAFQYWKNQDIAGRTRFLALKEGYHGDTIGAMSVGDRGLFNDIYGELLFAADLIEVPYDHWGREGLEEAETAALARVALHLEQHGGEYAALILEPLIQGAGGMLMYRPQFLKSLVNLAQEAGILVIFDEVMTGFGRTGEYFACVKAGVCPDILCMSKGLSGGVLPLAATLANDRVYEAFLGSDPRLTLYHGHSYTANPLGCAAGLASLDLMRTESEAKFRGMEAWHREELGKLAGHPRLEKLRALGAVAAMDYKPAEGARYNQRSELIQAFQDQGVLLRPLGKTIYVLHPYCITRAELAQVYQAIRQVLDA